jgi:hypothetical protein
LAVDAAVPELGDSANDGVIVAALATLAPHASVAVATQTATVPITALQNLIVSPRKYRAG